MSEDNITVQTVPAAQEQPAPKPETAPESAPLEAAAVPSQTEPDAPAQEGEQPALALNLPGEAPAPLSSGNRKVVVIGLGGSGTRTLSKLRTMPAASWLKLFAIDTDREALKACTAQERLLAASEWRDGAGCGGDVLKGERSISRERARLSQLLEGASLLVVTGGLGGGTATGGARILASIAKSASIPTIFLLGTPFSFESHRRRKAAEDCIAELLPIVDVLLCLPNDLLFSTLSSDVPVDEAFAKASEELAGAVFGVAEILRCRNLLSADFATLMAALHERRASCGVGSGRASSSEGLNRCHLALERMLASPFLGGGVSMLESADAVIASVTGGPDLEIGEMKKTLETLASHVNGSAELLTGANTDTALSGTVQVTVVAIKYDQRPEKAAVSHETAQHWGSGERGLKQVKETAQEKKLEQGLFELQSYSKGIFSKNAPTKYKDEDLDIPTFQRRNVSIDKGNVGR